MRTRIAVTGAHGQLGAAVVHELSSGHDVVALGHADLDVTDVSAVSASMARIRPQAIINCVAYNDVDGSEDRPIDALNLNAFAVRTLALAAKATSAAFVHYSSDFVFDGSARTPYTEESVPNPRSVYAASKLLGEWFALEAPRPYVLRVESLFGRAPGARPAKGSVATIVNALAAGRETRVFEDRIVTPTFVIDAARATRHLLDTDAPTGLYHCVNTDRCSWLDFARELARQMGVEPRLVPVRMHDVALRAARPLYCAMSNARLASTGFAMPSWQDALARYLQSVGDDRAHQLSNR